MASWQQAAVMASGGGSCCTQRLPTCACFQDAPKPAPCWASQILPRLLHIQSNHNAHYLCINLNAQVEPMMQQCHMQYAASLPFIACFAAMYFCSTLTGT
jgi:hypothetical protein